jgi:hypothetical protein
MRRGLGGCHALGWVAGDYRDSEMHYLFRLFVVPQTSCLSAISTRCHCKSYDVSQFGSIKALLCLFEALQRAL